MDEEQIEVVQRIRNERANLEERIKVAKLDLKIEREKAPFLRAMLKMEQNTTQNLARREKFFTDVSKTMEESEKNLKKVRSALILPGFRDTIYAAVEEILRYRQTVSDERIRKHQKAMADSNDDLLRDPEFQATIGRQKMLVQLEKELEEIDLQSAPERAEIDKIVEEQQKVVESYEANIRELQTEIDNEEAEIAQIDSEDARDTAPNSLAATVQPEAAKEPFYFRKFEVFESLDGLVLPPDDESFDESMPAAEKLLAIANEIAQDESNSSPTEAHDESISNQSPQPTGQDDHSYAQSERANESNVVEAKSAQPPLFVAPLAPAPHVRKRKENAPENVLPAKKGYFDRSTRGPVESSETSRESPRKSPCKLPTDPPSRSPDELPRRSPVELPRRLPDELPRRSPDELPRRSPVELPRRSPVELPRRSPVELPRRSPVELPRRSPQRGSDFTKTNRMDRFGPDLSLVKKEFPTEQKLTTVQPAQASMGATPSEVVLQLHGQHRGIERARHLNQSSAFQPIETYRRSADNRTIGLSGSSGQSDSKAPTVLPSAKAPATATATAPTDGNGKILRIHTHSRNVQATTSRPAQLHDTRYTQSTGHRDDDDDAFPGFEDDMAAFSGTAFHSQQSMFSTAKEMGGKTVTASAVESSTQKRANSGNETSRFNRNEQPASSRPDQRGGDDAINDNDFVFEDSSFSGYNPNLSFNPNVMSNDRSGATSRFENSFNSDLSFSSRARNDAGGAGGATEFALDWGNDSEDFGNFGDV